MSRTYLIIDDSLTARMKLKEVLAGDGVEVLLAESGGSGTEVARLHRPDVAILDVVLPDTDGVELCQEWQGDPVLRHVPVLLVSAQRAERDDRVAGLRSGAMGYLVKPFDDRELLAQVELLHGLGAAQRELRRRFLRAVESAPNPMLLLNRSGEIVLVNGRAERLFGREPGKLEGSPIHELVPDLADGLDAAALETFYAALCERPLDPGRDLCGRRADGGEFPLSVAFNPTRTDDGPAALAAIVDLTERKRAEQELRRAAEEQGALNEELRRRNDELRAFAHIVSHDLKAPLRAIGSLVDCVVEDYAEQLDDEGRKNLALLKGRTERMHELIGGILRYSSAGHGGDEVEEIDTDELLELTVSALAPPDSIEIEIDRPLPRVSYHPIQLKQVFQNLVSNAITYMDKEHGWIRISCADTEPAWRFCVADNGPGIPGHQLERVFQIFQTLAPRDEREATGVGLAIVRRIVEENGGAVWVESAPGEGSRFIFTIPKQGARRGRAEEARS